MSDFTQFSQEIYSFNFSSGNIILEIVNKRDGSDKIKLYNDIPNENGINEILSFNKDT